MSKHTPGPWVPKRKKVVYFTAHVIFETKTGAPYCGVFCPVGDPEQEANVSLIEAAPEMLEALEIIGAQSVGPDWALSKPCNSSRKRRATRRARQEGNYHEQSPHALPQRTLAH